MYGSRVSPTPRWKRSVCMLPLIIWMVFFLTMSGRNFFGQKKTTPLLTAPVPAGFLALRPRSVGLGLSPSSCTVSVLDPPFRMYTETDTGAFLLPRYGYGYAPVIALFNMPMPIRVSARAGMFLAPTLSANLVHDPTMSLCLRLFSFVWRSIFFVSRLPTAPALTLTRFTDALAHTLTLLPGSLLLGLGLLGPPVFYPVVGMHCTRTDNGTSCRVLVPTGSLAETTTFVLLFTGHVESFFYTPGKLRSRRIGPKESVP